MTLASPNENPARAKIRRAIGYGSLAYDNLIHQYYVNWCGEMAAKFYHQERALIQNEALFSYYRTQWETLVERLMMKDYGGYLRTPDTKVFFFERISEYAAELKKYYPASLLRKPVTVKKSNYQFNLN